MTKNEIKKKMSILYEIAGEIYRASSTRKDIEEEMLKASGKIEKSAEILESVFHYLEWIEK